MWCFGTKSSYIVFLIQGNCGLDHTLRAGKWQKAEMEEWNASFQKAGIRIGNQFSRQREGVEPLSPPPTRLLFSVYIECEYEDLPDKPDEMSLVAALARLMSGSVIYGCVEFS